MTNNNASNKVSNQFSSTQQQQQNQEQQQRKNYPLQSMRRNADIANKASQNVVPPNMSIRKQKNEDRSTQKYPLDSMKRNNDISRKASQNFLIPQTSLADNKELGVGFFNSGRRNDNIQDNAIQTFNMPNRSQSVQRNTQTNLNQLAASSQQYFNNQMQMQPYNGQYQQDYQQNYQQVPLYSNAVNIGKQMFTGALNMASSLRDSIFPPKAVIPQTLFQNSINNYSKSLQIKNRRKQSQLRARQATMNSIVLNQGRSIQKLNNQRLKSDKNLQKQYKISSDANKQIVVQSQQVKRNQQWKLNELMKKTKLQQKIDQQKRLQFQEAKKIELQSLSIQQKTIELQIKAKQEQQTRNKKLQQQKKQWQRVAAERKQKIQQKLQQSRQHEAQVEKNETSNKNTEFDNERTKISKPQFQQKKQTKDPLIKESTSEYGSNVSDNSNFKSMDKNKAKQQQFQQKQQPQNKAQFSQTASKIQFKSIENRSVASSNKKPQQSIQKKIEANNQVLNQKKIDAKNQVQVQKNTQNYNNIVKNAPPVNYAQPNNNYNNNNINTAPVNYRTFFNNNNNNNKVRIPTIIPQYINKRMKQAYDLPDLTMFKSNLVQDKDPDFKDKMGRKRVKIDDFVKQQIQKDDQNDLNRKQLLNSIKENVFSQSSISQRVNQMRRKFFYFPTPQIYNKIKSNFPTTSVDDIIFRAVVFDQGELSSLDIDAKVLRKIYQNLRAWGGFLFDIQKLEKAASQKHGSAQQRTYHFKSQNIIIKIIGKKTQVSYKGKNIQPQQFQQKVLRPQAIEYLKQKGKNIYQKYLKKQLMIN